jgi:hypothetical protein
VIVDHDHLQRLDLLRQDAREEFVDPRLDVARGYDDADERWGVDGALLGGRGWFDSVASVDVCPSIPFSDGR